MNAVRTWTILGLLSLALYCRDAQAYCRATTVDPQHDVGPTASPLQNAADGCPTGNPLYWPSACVGIHVDKAASQNLSLEAARHLLGDAFAEWQAAGGQCLPSIQVIQLSPSSSPKIGYETDGTNENDVVFRDDSWPYGGNIDGSLLLVTTTFAKDTGELLDADIEMNGTQIPALLARQDTDAGADPTTNPGLRRVFLHAAGHFLGFGHSTDLESVMYEKFSPSDTTLPELTADDAAGMCAAYPESGKRPVLDAEGQPKNVSATACNLSMAAASTSCSSSAIRLDHGCSVGRAYDSAHAADAVFLTIAGLGMLSLRARRRRRSLRLDG